MIATVFLIFILKQSLDLAFSAFSSNVSFREFGKLGGLIVSVPDSGASGPGSNPGWGHCVVFLGKTLYSHSASLHLSV